MTAADIIIAPEAPPAACKQPIPHEDRAASSTLKVLEAARDLHALQQLVTRESLEQATGLKLHVVDERVRVLINQGHLRRVQKGVYVPAVMWPEPRPISKTLLGNGMVKIEIGDTVLTLSPHEDRLLSSLQGGALLQLSAIEANRQAAEVGQDMAQALARAMREVMGGMSQLG